MERIKEAFLRKMSLKKSLFFISLGCLLVSLLLAIALWQGCNRFSARYPQGGVAIEEGGVVRALEEPTPGQRRILAVVTGIQVGSVFLMPVCGLAAAAYLFYHFKLKPPIAALRMGTARIREHDLDFIFPAVSGDELGEICAAFETMRAELLKTNRELWHQAEERKRLNAAFSHDLRNPITVLKGTVKLMRQGRADEQALARMESYTLRMEQYVEAMSSIQRLEQMPVKRKPIAFCQLKRELAETAGLLAPSLQLCLEAEAAGREEDQVLIDYGIFLGVAENLISNAVRFSRDRLFLTLKRQGNFLLLAVGDNGDGFPAELVQKGAKPFWRAELVGMESCRRAEPEEKGEKPFGREDPKEERCQADAEAGRRELEEATPVHLGMGLYSCEILCRKHGGELTLRNVGGRGGEATARFCQ